MAHTMRTSYINKGLLKKVGDSLPVMTGGSGSLVLCNTVVPDNTVMKPHSSDAILLTL